ncbi:PadR family transcriptional regulator [Candidatus Woesearchaeota archaeon]|nr:PadR family transcriptional regulator [Candidatus Woesearchaeota archaeon]
MKSININNMIKLYTILLLNRGNVHGYDIIKHLEHNLENNISASQVYPFLNELKRKKLIKINKEGERDKKSYSLTPTGKKFISDTLKKWDELLEIAFVNKITKCYHCSCELYNNKYKKLINKKELPFCCDHCADSYMDMVKNKKIYTCDICSFSYKTKELKDKCQNWCKNYKSCNLEIIKYATNK